MFSKAKLIIGSGTRNDLLPSHKATVKHAIRSKFGMIQIVNGHPGKFKDRDMTEHVVKQINTLRRQAKYKLIISIHSKFTFNMSEEPSRNKYILKQVLFPDLYAADQLDDCVGVVVHTGTKSIKKFKKSNKSGKSGKSGFCGDPYGKRRKMRHHHGRGKNPYVRREPIDFVMLRKAERHAMRNLTNNILWCLRKMRRKGLNNVKILMETSSCGLGDTASQLEDFFKVVWFDVIASANDSTEKKYFKKHLGICIDTAHIFNAGYDIYGYNAMSMTLDFIESIITTANYKVNEVIGLFHFNDTPNGLGSGNRDRHGNFFAPTSQALSLGSVQAITKWATKYNIPMVLETPETNPNKSQHKLEIKIARDCHKLKKHASANMNNSNTIPKQNYSKCKKSQYYCINNIVFRSGSKSQQRMFNHADKHKQLHSFYVATDFGYRDRSTGKIKLSKAYASFKNLADFKTLYYPKRMGQWTCYELIRQNHECKVYFDFDWKTDTITDVDVIVAVQRWINKELRPYLLKHKLVSVSKKKLKKILQYQVWTSATIVGLNKGSLHLILPKLIVKSNELLRSHVKTLLSKTNNSIIKQTLDWKVYTKNRLMRLVYSRKLRPEHYADVGSINMGIFIPFYFNTEDRIAGAKKAKFAGELRKNLLGPYEFEDMTITGNITANIKKVKGKDGSTSNTSLIRAI